MKLMEFVPSRGRPAGSPGSDWFWAVTTAALFVSVASLPSHAAVADEDSPSAPQRLSIDAGDADPKARLVAEPTADAEIVPVPQEPAAIPAESDPAPSPSEARAASPTPAASPAPANSAEAPAAVESPGSQAPAASATAAGSPTPASIGAVQPIKAVADAASFKGIQPGHSTRDDVVASWGEPKQQSKVQGRLRFTYEIAPFSKVAVLFEADTVQAVIVSLERAVKADLLAEQLQITGITPVAVPDERGQIIGESYPERGVLFVYDPKQDAAHVLQVVLEPLDPQPFLLRGEIRCEQLPAHSLADADFALELDPKLARAHWLRAECLRQLGCYIDALPAAQQAFVLEPGRAEYRLTLIALMLEQGDYARAEQHLDELLASKPGSPLVLAQAYGLVGDCLTGTVNHDFPQAIEFYQRAIKQAETLTADTNPMTRRAAKDVMVCAHLGVARAIALGRWQQKHKIVPKWLARAKGFADDMIAREGVSEDVLQRVHNSAMTTLASVPGGQDARQWIDATQKLGRKLILAAEPQRRGIMEWQLGIALSDAVAIEQSQGRPAEAARLGELAVKLLQSGHEAGSQTPGHDFLVGKLYFRLGAIAALDRQDHKGAVAWYDQSIPLLQSPVPAGPLTDAARQGDMFVSMAVSYWEVGGRDQAVRLTREGARLLEVAVDEGIAQRKALTVPYGNLATMFTDLGDDSQAKRYTELAARNEPKKMK